MQFDIIRSGSHLRVLSIVIALLVASNFYLLYEGTYSIEDIEINRQLSLASQLYEDNDIQNPRFQRARSWLVTDRYDDSFKEQFGNVKSYQKFDPRLATSIWLDMINENLQDSPQLLPQDFKLPFNWGMILDLSQQMLQHPYYNKIIEEKLTCKEFSALDPAIQKRFPGRSMDTCVDYNYEKPNFVNPLQLPFKLTGKDNIYMEDLNMRKFYCIMYCLSGLPTPSKMLFLGAIDNMGLKKSLVVPLETVNIMGNHSGVTEEAVNSLLRHYSDLYIDRQLEKGELLNDVLVNGISTYKGLYHLNQFIFNTLKPQKFYSQTNLYQTYNAPTIIGVGETGKDRELLSFTPDLFEWNLDHELDVIEQQIGDNQGKNEQLVHIERLLLDKKDHLINKEPRYWGLASSRGEKLDHFDFRFFRSNVKRTNPDLHMTVLHRLTRTWFKLCHEFGVPTWLNHGPLIGWYWNGLNLNYDSDIDVQLPIQSLLRLAKLINDTLIYDFINEKEYINDEAKIDNSAELGLRSFYFEVADSFVSRTNALSLYNNIDARLIDTQTGVYIDITALLSLVSHADNKPHQVLILNRMRNKQVSRFILSQFYDEFYDGITLKDEIMDEQGDRTWQKIVNKSKMMLNDYIKVFTETDGMLDNFVHDRNYHFYNLSELMPLIPTFHENYETYIPSNFLKNLIVEYGDKQVILRPYYLRYKFFYDLKLWVSQRDCPVYDIGDGKLVFHMDEHAMNKRCADMNAKVRDTAKVLKPYLDFHSEELNILLGGDSRDEKVLNELMKGERHLNYDLHMAHIKDHLDHIMRPEPFLLDNFYDSESEQPQN